MLNVPETTKKQNKVFNRACENLFFKGKGGKD